MEELDEDHPLRQQFLEAAWETVAPVERLRDMDDAVQALAGFDFVEKVTLARWSWARGRPRWSWAPAAACSTRCWRR